jgi:hypothetical protein
MRLNARARHALWILPFLALVFVLVLFAACSGGGSDGATSVFEGGAALPPPLPEAAALPPRPEAGNPGVAPPTGVHGVPADGYATVSWNPVPDATGYAVTASPGGATATSTGSTVEVHGLTNGTAYTFTVTVTTPAGTSPPSLPSDPVVPAGYPDAPSAVTAVAGSGAATVSWTAPNDHGAAIQSYSVSSNPPGGVAQASGSRTSVAESGLTNGTSYTFVVVAINAVGQGALSNPSNAVTPLPPPNAPDTPVNVVASATDGSATISWPAPNDKGLAITGYTILSSPEGRKASSTTTSVVMSGLTNGTSYTFTVSATNSAGTSIPSAPSNAVTPVGPPGAPTSILAVRGDGQATVSWTAPNSGGHPITQYTVTSQPGGIVATTTTTSTAVTGLTNGTSYRFTVVAASDLGPSPASAPSNAVTPAASPGAPSGVTAVAGNGTAYVSWAAAADNGSPITSYTITSSPGGVTSTVVGTSGTVGGLVNGTSYTFTVVATNAVAQSPASSPTSAVVPGSCVQTTYIVTNPGTGYSFSGVVGLNPVVTVCRGQTYTFHLQNVNGHPFAVLTGGFTFHSGVTNNGSEGTVDIVWTVPSDEPQSAGTQYSCLIHPPMTNLFDIR